MELTIGFFDQSIGADSPLFNSADPYWAALERFKRKVMNEEIIKESKKHVFYLKPGQMKRLKAVEARKRARKSKSRSHGEDLDERRSPSALL